MGEGHQENVLKQQVEFSKPAESSMKIILFCVSSMAVSPLYVVRRHHHSGDET